MGVGLLGVGVSGLNTAQGGLLTTSHNIANASTPGYMRQSVLQRAITPQFSGSGFIGKGSEVFNVERAYDEFLSGLVNTAQTSLNELDKYSSQLILIDDMLSDPTVGLSPAITTFFEGLSTVSNTPSSIPARQSLLSSGQALVNRFHELDERLTALKEGVNSQLINEVTAINGLATQVSTLNDRIAKAESAGSRLPANDLRDERDRLITELSKHIRITVVEQSSGDFSVFVGNGQPLVMTAGNAVLTTTQARDDPSRIEVGLVSPNGSNVYIQEELLSGGTMGGLLRFRRESLDSVQASFGRIAMGMAMAMNTQHNLGQDLTGAMGKDMFEAPVPQVFANSRNAVPALGSITATVNDIGALTTSDYQLTNTAGGYMLVRLSDNQQIFVNSTLPITAEGLTFYVTGAPAVGESWKISPTRYGARDIEIALTDAREVAAGTPVVASAVTGNSGTGKISQGTLVQPVTISYDTTSGGYKGFPVGTSVTVNGVSTDVASVNQSVAFVNGDLVTVNGISFTPSGVPSNGDIFTIGPNELSSGANNASPPGISLSAMQSIGATTLTFDSSFGATGGLTGFPIGSTIAVTSVAGVVSNYRINLSTEQIPYTVGSTYSYNGMTFSFGGAAPLTGETFTVSGAAGGTFTDTSATANFATGTLQTASADLPLTSYTLTYDKVNNRLTGFPPGVIVNRTVAGTTTAHAMTGQDAALTPLPPGHVSGITYTSGMSLTINGVKLDFNGTPNDGDKFTVGPAASGTADNRNLILMGALQTTKTLLGGTASFEQSYAQLISIVGNKARETNVAAESQQTQLTQAENAWQSYSGVNLDEEAANLLKYQQAYQASAKVIEIASRLFDQLLSLGN